MTKQQYLLAAMLSDPEICDYCVDNLRISDFPDDIERDIFSAAKTIRFNGQAFDFVNLDIYLDGPTDEEKELQKKAGDVLSSWVSGILPNIVNRPHDWKVYARELIKARHDSNLWKDIEKAKTASDPIGEIKKAIEKASKSSADLEEEVQDSDSSDDVLNIMKEYLSQDGIDTGFHDLDASLNGGFSPGRMYIIGARPAVGKSSLMLQLAIHAASRGNVVVYYSYEMNKAEIYQRAIALCMGIPSQDLPRNLTPGSVRFFDSLKSKFFVYDKADLDVDGIATYSKKIREKTGRLDMIFVDYLQIVPESKGTRNRLRYEAVGEISQKLKRFCLQEMVAVIAAAQLSRQTVAREEPILSDLKESGNLEQDCDCCLLLSRTDELAKIQIAKNRSGPCGTLTLRFVPSLTKFVEDKSLLVNDKERLQ